MANFKNYNPGKVILSFNKVQIVGYADGTFVKATRDTPSFSDKAGAGGDVVRTRSLDKRGSIVITIQTASPSNDILSGFILSDELKGNAVGMVQLVDGNGTSLFEGANAWVQQPADGEFAAESGNREWTIRVAELKIFNGGYIS